MRVLVTGLDGYIGAVLGPFLIDRGLDVVGLDTGYYRQGWLYPMGGVRPATITKDLRDLSATDFEGFDAVVHMAELSNDPIGQQDPALTYEINHLGSMTVATCAKTAGVARFIYTSSCSVYGSTPKVGEFVDEMSSTNPLTAYARCKLKVEQDISRLTNADFTTCFLRNATAYGASPRQRFDIVMNDFCGLAWTTGSIKLNSDGSAWRPLVHILDISEAIYRALIADPGVISGQIMNVGSSGQNYRAIDIAEIVSAEFPGCKLDVGSDSVDNRSYRVNFDKIGVLLPDFKCEWSAADGARQMRSLFESIEMTPEIFNSPLYTRLTMLDSLRAKKLLDSKLFWTYQ